MYNLLLNPSKTVSNSPFEIPLSQPNHTEPKENDFAKYLTEARKTAQQKSGNYSQAPAHKDISFEKPESFHESQTSRQNTFREPKDHTVEDSVTAKTESHVNKQVDNSTNTTGSKTVAHDDKKADEEGKSKKSIRQMIEDALQGQSSQNPLASILAQIMQLLGANNSDTLADANADLSQGGIGGVQQIIDLLKTAIGQNNGKQGDIASKPDAALQQQMDALISMLSGQNNDAAQAFQSIVADQGKANLFANQVGLNIVTGQIEKLASAQTGEDKAQDSKELLSKIAGLAGDEKLASQIMKDVKITNVTATDNTSSDVTGKASEIKSGINPASVVQLRDLKSLQQIAAEDVNPKTSGQGEERFGKTMVQAVTSEGGTKPLNLTVLQTQLLGKEKPTTLTSATPAPLIQNLSQHMPDQVPEVETATPHVGSKEIFSQIIEQAKVMVNNGRNEMEINLKPENLGKIHLKVSMENQIVTAKFVAESQQVKEIIETNLAHLRSHLQENGIQVDALMVSVGNSNQGQSFEQMAQNQGGWSNSRSFSGSAQDSFVESAADADEGRKSLHNSMIDLIA